MGVLYFMEKTSIILHFYIDDCFYFLYFLVVRNRVVLRFNAYLDMQKSKKMMVSLCGLALSSLFVLNNKSVVHADTINDANSQNNAISWNSDSDAAQNVQNTQKADDDQQNTAQSMQSRAETSTVRSVSAAPRTTNQNTPVQSPRVANVQDAQKTSPVVINNPANNKVHVHYVDTNGNAVDNSSHDDDYDGSYDYDIDATETGQGSYDVPDGYSLNNPDGKYTISSGALNDTDLYASTDYTPAVTKRHPAVTEYHPAETKDHPAVTHVVHHPASGFWDDEPNSNLSHIGSDYTDKGTHKVWIKTDPYDETVVDKKAWTETIPAWTETITPAWTETITPAYTTQTLPVAFVDSNNNVVGMIQNYTGKVGTTQDISLTVPTGYKLADDMSLPTSVTFQDSTYPLLIDVVPNGKTQRITNPSNNTINVKFVDQTTGWQVGSDAINLTKVHNGINYYNVPDGYGADVNSYYVDGAADTGRRSFTDDFHTIRDNTVTVPVHESTTYQFADPSGNAKSAQGNTVDVILTKPQSVDPDSNTFCHSQATRTIQINFPDGQIPDSYKDIVDSHGNLKQTVHFTRPATEDALTGNILWYGNWTSDNKDHNFIGFEARTLPRIPGYTLKISPVSAQCRVHNTKKTQLNREAPFYYAFNYFL